MTNYKNINCLFIATRKGILKGIIEYFDANYSNILITYICPPDILNKKSYSKKSMAIQMLLNTLCLFFRLITLKKPKVDYVLLDGLLTTIPYLVLIKVFPFLIPRRRIILARFIFNKLNNNRSIQIILRILLNNKKIILVVISEKEKLLYEKVIGINNVYIVYCPLCVSNFPTGGESGKGREYIFSGGVINRDYNCLIKAAENIKQEFIIVCSTLNNIKSDANNIQILKILDYTDFNGYLDNAKIVVVPLENGNMNAGYLLALSAMFLKKPIIYSDVDCLTECFEPNVTGIPYKRGDCNDLINKIKDLLANPQKMNELGMAAHERYMKFFHISNYYKFIGNMVMSDKFIADG